MNNDTIKGQVDQFIGAAKTQWGKLTDDDFLRVKGDAQKLRGLVQERYGVSQDQAAHQVAEWERGRKAAAMDSHKS